MLGGGGEGCRAHRSEEKLGVFAGGAEVGGGARMERAVGTVFEYSNNLQTCKVLQDPQRMQLELACGRPRRDLSM